MTYKLFIILITLTFFVNAVSAGNLKGKVKLSGEGLNNVVVYLEPSTNKQFSPSKNVATMDQINMNFVPHVLPVMLGTKVIFPNSDKIRHSVFSVSKIKKFDFGTYPPGVEKSIICDQPGVIPVLCYIHHDMSGYIVVLSTPFFSLTDDNGEYDIKNIPAGKYLLKFWHEEAEIKTLEVVIPSQGTVIKNVSAVD